MMRRLLCHYFGISGRIDDSFEREQRHGFLFVMNVLLANDNTTSFSGNV
jgi:hypothetical protein